MAHMAQMPARTHGWVTCQRKAINLPPTVTSLHWGVPYAPRMQHAPPMPETAEQRSHHKSREFNVIGSYSYKTRQAFNAGAVPSWGSRIETSGPNGIMSRTPVNVAPTVQYQRRMLSTTPRRALDASQLKQPDVYDLSPQVPAYGDSINKTNEISTRAVTYLVVGAAGVITFAGVRGAVRMAIGSMAPAMDVLAMSKIEVDLSKIPEGKNIILKWRGKPVFIRHRTQDEIKRANDIDLGSLRDPEKDSDRTQKPEWLIMLGVCTHLGCVPIGEAGDYHGWFCPCHGSHYDISGRIRKGPAPLNLEVPEYAFMTDDLITIG